MDALFWERVALNAPRLGTCVHFKGRCNSTWAMPNRACRKHVLEHVDVIGENMGLVGESVGLSGWVWWVPWEAGISVGEPAGAALLPHMLVLCRGITLCVALGCCS